MDKMGHHVRHETPHLHSSAYGRRVRPPGGQVALVECLCPPSLPDSAGECPGRAAAPDRRFLGLQRPDRPQRHPSLRARRHRRLPHPPLPSAASAGDQARWGGGRAGESPRTPEPAQFRVTNQPLDPRTGRRRQLCPRDHVRAGQQRDHPQCLAALGREGEAHQAWDYQSRSRVRPEKRARDRLIRLAPTHPDWVLGFLDEVWWSRFAQPSLHAWSTTD